MSGSRKLDGALRVPARVLGVIMLHLTLRRIRHRDSA